MQAHHLEHLTSATPGYLVMKEIQVPTIITVHYFNSHYKKQLLSITLYQLKEQ